MWRMIAGGLACLLLACSGAPLKPVRSEPVPPTGRPSTPKRELQALTEEQAAALTLLPEETLAHTPFRGPFGPADDCVDALVFRGPRRELGAVLWCGEAVVRTSSLQSWAGDEVSAVLFEDIDGDGFVELVALATFITGMGPEGVIPFQANVVLAWDGGKLVQKPEVEAKIAQLATADEVREALRR